MAKRFTATLKTTLLGTAMVACSLNAPAAFAGPEDDPSGAEMMVDAAIARPIGLVTTLVGAATFVVTLPFSALGGNIDQAASKLVAVKPVVRIGLRAKKATSSKLRPG